MLELIYAMGPLYQNRRNQRSKEITRLSGFAKLESDAIDSELKFQEFPFKFTTHLLKTISYRYAKL